MRILIAVVLVFSSLAAFASQKVKCDERYSLALSEGMAKTKPLFKKLINDIDHAIATREELSRKVVKRLAKSKEILKCSEERARDFEFQCYEGLTGYFMQVTLLFGDTVKIATHYLDEVDTDYVAASLVHEATHKCGAIDAAYFRQNQQTPRTTYMISWPYIASTYDYWAIKGFCIPEVDC